VVHVILLGLIIVLLALAAGTLLYLATQNLSDPIELEAAGFAISATPLALLIAGAAVMLILWLGLAMIRGSLRRKTRRRREAKEAARAAENEQRIREDERARIAAEAPAQRFAGPGDAALGAAGAASAAGAMADWHDTRSRDDVDDRRHDTSRGDFYDQDADRTQALPADSRSESADERAPGRHAAPADRDASETTVYSTSAASDARRDEVAPGPDRTDVDDHGERADAERGTAGGRRDDSHRTVADDVMGRKPESERTPDSDRTVADDVRGRTPHRG